MTEKEIEELYQNIIDSNDLKNSIIELKKEYKNNNNPFAYEKIKDVINICFDRISDNKNDKSLYILYWFILIDKDLDKDILDFSINYCEEREKNNNIDKFYGVSAYTVYRITKKFDWYCKYLRVSCKIQIFGDDDEIITNKLKYLFRSDFVFAINILIGGLDVTNNKCSNIIKQLISDDCNVALIFDSLSKNGKEYLYRFLVSYLGRSAYINEYEIIKELMIRKYENIEKILKDFVWYDSGIDNSNFLFLNSISKYLNKKISFSSFITEFFKNYKKFIDSGLYRKIINLNIDNLDELINKIEKLRKYNNTNNSVNVDIPELTSALREETSNIYEKIVNMTLYEINIDDLKNLNISYSYYKKKDYYKGTNMEDIIKQARIVKDIMGDICSSCNQQCNLKKDLDKFLNEPSEANAKNIFGDNIKNCKNSKLRKELSKLKRSIMSMSYPVTIFGEYYNESKTIILYLQNIYDAYEDGCGKKLLCTFAHELFHAYHAICVESCGKTWNDPKPDSIIVKESLASYFEYKFIFECKQYELSTESTALWNESWDKLSCELNELWRNYVIDSCPYAGAKHLNPYSDFYYPKYALFRYVFMESLKSIPNAVKMIRFGEKMEFGDY